MGVKGGPGGHDRGEVEKRPDLKASRYGSPPGGFPVL